MTTLVPEPRYTRTGVRIPAGHATLICMCGPDHRDATCESVRNPPPCSFPGCGKPTAWLPGPEGFGWRHVIPDDETASHAGYPWPRTEEEQ